MAWSSSIWPRWRIPTSLFPPLPVHSGYASGSGNPTLTRCSNVLAPKHMLLILDNFEQVLAAAPA